MHTSLHLAAAALATITFATSQDSPAPARSPAVDLSRLLTPIHTQPDDPIGGAYGVWVAGPTWKASFHDGFHFYAYAANLPEHPTLGWRTESFTAGDEALPLGTGVTSWTAKQHETRFESLREVYEISLAGVEQTFVIAARPQHPGDIVVTGRVTTNLEAEVTAPRVGALAFRLDGEERIRYGKALAFDSAGRQTEVATSFDGDHIRLHVPAAFAANAVYPLTIDPLTTALACAGSNAVISDVTWTGSSAPGSTTAITAFIVRSAANDLDLVSYTCTEAGGVGLNAFQDVTNSWMTRSVDSTEVVGTNRWVLAFYREFPTTSTFATRVHVLDINFNPGAGTTLFPAGGTLEPRIGGRRDGNTALLVSYADGDITLQTVDTSIPSLGSSFTIPGSFNTISVSRAASFTSAWCVVTSDSTIGVEARLVNTTPAVVATGLLGAPTNAARPEVDGTNGRFLATWVDTVTTGLVVRLRAQRFDVSGTTFSLGTVHTVGTVPLTNTTISNGEIAYDYSTQSHWAVTWLTDNWVSPTQRSARIARLGYQGGVVESQTLYSTTSSVDRLLPFVCFDGTPLPGARPSFSAGYVEYVASATGYELFHRRFDYDPAAQSVLYGSSCANPVLGEGHAPFAGSQFYNVSVQGVPANSIALLAAGTVPLNVPLDFLGMIGCTMLVDPIVLLTVPTDGSGAAVNYISLPDVPAYFGDLYVQWAWFDAAANPLGLVNSRGMHVQVR